METNSMYHMILDTLTALVPQTAVSWQHCCAKRGSLIVQCDNQLANFYKHFRYVMIYLFSEFVSVLLSHLCRIKSVLSWMGCLPWTQRMCPNTAGWGGTGNNPFMLPITREIEPPLFGSFETWQQVFCVNLGACKPRWMTFTSGNFFAYVWNIMQQSEWWAYTRAFVFEVDWWIGWYPTFPAKCWCSFWEVSHDPKQRMTDFGHVWTVLDFLHMFSPKSWCCTTLLWNSDRSSYTTGWYGRCLKRNSHSKICTGPHPHISHA